MDRQTASQIERLRKRRDFLAAARGAKRAERGLVLQLRQRDDTAPARVGFTVTRKVGSAVVRNRAKRRLRAAAAEILPLAAKAGYDYVLIGRQGTLTRSWSDLLSDLRHALKSVHENRASSATAASNASETDSGKDAPHG
ncbi:MAG: ribonuclease P protein component [Parvibaculum sp.]